MPEPKPKLSAEVKIVDAPSTDPTAYFSAPPFVMEEKKKKKKRRYSRGSASGQNLGRGVARSAETISEGVARTFSDYDTRRNKSSFKKRDGAVRDGIDNWTKALSKGMRFAGKAPYQFFKIVTRGPGSKQVRNALRLFTPPPLR